MQSFGEMSVIASHTKICRLFSADELIPHQSLALNTSLVIGRNRECRITDLKCSRSHCEAFFDGHSLRVTNTKSGATEVLANGRLLSGPGFQYKIVIISDSADANDSTLTEIDSRNAMNGMKADESVFSYNDSEAVVELKSLSEQTQWQTSCLGRVHICRFLGGGLCRSSVAAFDFDGTLVTQKSGNKFPKDANDWKLLDKSLPEKIKKLVDNGFRFVVISNQLGVSQGRTKIDDIKVRFESALTAIGVPCFVLIAAYDDVYRKPRPGLWQILNNESSSAHINLETSFYVGDAAGRTKKLNNISDHSAADILFAANTNLPFLTPELFFGDVKPKKWNSSTNTFTTFTINSFRPQACDYSYLAMNLVSNQKFTDINELLKPYSNAVHLIVFCGLPASGKSSFYSNHLESLDYCYVSRDQLKTIDKCEKKVVQFLAKGKKCVIDNTNVDTASRHKWIDLCKKHSAVCLLFHFTVSVKQALHNNIFRRIIGVNTPVTDLVIYSHNKNFVIPSINEGFDAIYAINFVPKFADKNQELLYFMYLKEK